MSLGLYVARRLLDLVPTLFFVSVLIFLLQQLLPGDPALALAGEERDPAAVAAIRAKYHLDRPMVVQYRIWLGKVLRGDFGESLRNRIPVSELLASKLPVTIELAFGSMLLGTGVAGVMMRHTRSAMMQTLEADYVRTARAKSVPERLVVLKHALRNALIPVITLGAIEFGRLLSGAVLTEQIFNIPGFGKLLVDGVFNRDYAVVQAVVLVSAALYVLLNLLADVLYFVANPRMRGSA